VITQVKDRTKHSTTLDVEDAPSRGFWLRPSYLFKRSPAKIAQDDDLDQLGSEAQTQSKAGGKPPWFLITFIIMVLLPSLASLVYFTTIASDQYTAEARFAVRSLSDSGLGEKVDTGLMNMQAAPQDAYVVTSFIHSAEILRRLKGEIDYRAIFTDPKADYFSRFDPKSSEEKFLKYWDQHVYSYIDGPSGIVTLTVRSFRPQDSVELANAILRQSEKLVNEITLRARDDLLASFRQEVTRTKANYLEALQDFNTFQQKSGLLSPEVQAKQAGKLLTGLVAQKLELETRLFVLKESDGTDSPKYKQMERAKESLDSQVQDMQAQLVGSGNNSLANVIAGFSKLETNRQVSEKLYEAARRNYDLAFAAVSRKALYLTVFVPPALPEDSLYPKRVMSPLMIFLGLFVLWATLCLIWASVEDHML
jgi:capsular polysaccharide transport system permease protein